MSEKTFIIDGGLGRVITAIPALEKYVSKNPNTNILVHGWLPIIFGNKILSKVAEDALQVKGTFDKIKKTTIVRPEPYFNNDYINGRISLMDAWNQEINGDKESMPIPNIYLRKDEIEQGAVIRKSYHRKVIAFQPFGSTADISANGVKDNTLRSLDAKTTQTIVKSLKQQGYGIWLMTDKNIPFLNGTDFINHYPQSIRDVASIIYNCDYFLGIDSSGQHIARVFNKPGSIIMGGTNTKNVTYPDHFNIINDVENKEYMPYRLTEFDWWLSETLNKDIMNFDDKKIKEISTNIVKHIKKTTK